MRGCSVRSPVVDALHHTVSRKTQNRDASLLSRHRRRAIHHKALSPRGGSRRRQTCTGASFSDTPRPIQTKTVTEDPEKCRLCSGWGGSNELEVMPRCTDRLLEWDELCAYVSRFATTAAGKKACRALRRGADCAKALMLQAETQAIEALVAQLKVEFDFGSISTEIVKSALDHCARGGMLVGVQLKGVATLITMAQTLKTAIMNPFRKANLYRELRQIAEVVYRPWLEFEVDHELVNMIRFAIDEDGALKDSASEDLRKARHEFMRIRNKLEGILQSHTGEMVERSGRLCLAVPSQSAMPPNALVLDAGSKGTVYCEPRSALSLNNDLSVAYAEMKNAEESVLWNLTSQVAQRADNLGELFEMVIALDVAIARYRYTEWIDGAFPQFSVTDYGMDDYQADETSLFLSLMNLRHPLLLGQSLLYEEANARRQQKDSFRLAPPTPNDVILTEQTKALVITGPNAGGKTATLKALGLCALMAKAGLGLPAKHPVWIPFYSSVLADIGDEQSLSSSLSTFSGHLHRIQNLREIADGKCLVLLDELGTGTDPKEGAALGAALLKVLVEGGEGGALTTVVSTHHGLLKNLAYEQQVQNEDGTAYSMFENASMEFDDENLSPTYRMIMGVPGQSNALNIASRLGMDLRIIGAARSRLGQQHISENILISRIQDEQEGLEEIMDHIEKLEKKIRSAKKEIREIERRKASMEYQIAAQEADDYMHAHDRGKAELEVIRHKNIHVQLSSPLKQEAEDEGTLREEEEEEEVPEVQAERENWVPEVGDLVFVPDLGKEATLIKFTSKNKAVIRSGFLTITVESTTLQPL